MAETREEIKVVLNEFAIAAVEGAQAEALAAVKRLIASVPDAGLDRLLLSMTAGQALAFGRLLEKGWEAANAGNAAKIAAQKTVLAKILTALINAGVASLMVEMN